MHEVLGDRYRIGIDGERPRSTDVGDLCWRNGISDRDGAGVPSVLVGDGRLRHRVGDRTGSASTWWSVTPRPEEKTKRSLTASPSSKSVTACGSGVPSPQRMKLLPAFASPG